MKATRFIVKLIDEPILPILSIHRIKDKAVHPSDCR